MSEKKENKPTTGLNSPQAETVIESIKLLRESGVDTDLNTLVQLYEKTEHTDVQKEISQFFCDLKNRHSAETVIRLIKTATNKPVLQMLVASCWQSRLNYVDFLETFIDLVIYENFEISFEAFTVIESFEEPVSADRISELVAYARKKISECNPDNMTFAEDLIPIIENYKS